MAGTLRGVLASTLASSPVWTARGRTRLLRLLGTRLGPGTRVYPRILFLGRTDLLTLGRGCFVNAGLTVGSNATITIGDRVSIGPGVRLIPTTHEWGPASARAGRTVAAPISVGDGTWIGAGVTVLGGVSIGGGCIIAAGAVVTSDCEQNGVYGGVPAKLIRAIADE